METNILYYGNNVKINDIILKNVGRKKKQYNKGIIYWETKTSFIFQSSTSNTLIETIKQLVTTHCVVYGKRHNIIILNIDMMGEDNLRALRVILERYYKTTEFIATTLNISSIDNTIKSRFYLKRVEIHDKNKITRNIIFKKEWNVISSVAEIKKIAQRVQEYTLGDISRCLLNFLDDAEEKKQAFVEKAVKIEERYLLLSKNIQTVASLCEEENRDYFFDFDHQLSMIPKNRFIELLILEAKTMMMIPKSRKMKNAAGH